MSTQLTNSDESDTTPKATQEDSRKGEKASSTSFLGEQPSDLEEEHNSDDSESESETETEMSERRQDRHESSKSSSSKSSSKSSFKSPSLSSSKSSSKSCKPKKDDWSDVLEPDERRRIQNRIAQRKFREKTKEQKEANEREARNRESAGLAYSTPDAGSMDFEEELSGLPWGSLSLKHVVERGNTRERESQRSSQQQSYYGYPDTSSGRGSESRSR